MNSCYATGSLVPLDSISCLNKFKSIKCCQIIIKFTFNRFASASYTSKKIRYYSKGYKSKRHLLLLRRQGRKVFIESIFRPARIVFQPFSTTNIPKEKGINAFLKPFKMVN